MAELALQVPALSVIVPIYNRPYALMRCVEALAQQDYPRDEFEVIVFDDGGNVALEKILARFDKSGALRLVTAVRLERAITVQPLRAAVIG